MQSSGASLFTYFLGQIPDTVVVIDLWSECVAPKLKTKKNCILKATMNPHFDIEDHLRNYRPSVTVLYIRNPVQNYLSLDTKPYRDWMGVAEEKFKVLERVYLRKDSLFDLVVYFEDFLNNPTDIAIKLYKFGLDIPSNAIEFNRSAEEIITFNKKHSVWCRNNYEGKWELGNIHFNSLNKLNPTVYHSHNKSIEVLVSSLCPSVMNIYKQN